MGLKPNETALDKHKEKFEQIITLAEAIVKETTKSGLSLRFSFEFGIIPPLNLVTWKCRYPLIRRRALKLLLNYPRREGFLDTLHFQAMFGRIIEFEEAALGLESEQIPDENLLPPEHARIHHLQMMPRIDADNRYSVVFIYKPHGLSERWVRHVDYIDTGAHFSTYRSMIFCHGISDSAFMERDESSTTNNPSSVGDLVIRSKSLGAENNFIWHSMKGLSLRSCHGPELDIDGGIQ